jgi:hypothetical protein
MHCINKQQRVTTSRGYIAIRSVVGLVKLDFRYYEACYYE